MRTPITYYGGKQKMLPHIIPLIPEHKLYGEVFAGGLAVYWAKNPSEIEVINDLNGEVVNFYQVAKNHFEELQAMVQATLHSRQLHQDAWLMYCNPHLFAPLKRAWAFWVLCNQSFASSPSSSWGYGKTGNKTELKTHNKRELFLSDIQKRLEKTQIECHDALHIIRTRDSEDAFFYIDPPYYNADMGHYGGYKEADFAALLDTCANIKGKFLLSSYPSDMLAEATSRYGWHTKNVLGVVTTAKSVRKSKIEVLTANYPIT